MDITIFLASSSELKSDRDEFRKFIAELNEGWRDKNIYFDLKIWENFIDSMSKDGLQAEYNKVAQGCDFFVMLFQTKVGIHTSEEFESAYKQFQSNGRPIIFTFFKEDIIYTSQIDEEVITLLKFKNKLAELKHYPTIYKNMGDLQWKLSRQLETLCNKFFLTSSNIRNFSNRSEIDSLAIESVCKLLSPQTNDKTIDKLIVGLNDFIENSSEFGKSCAFQLAKVNRRSNRIANPALMSRSIPVFEALINSNKRRDKHYYFGQLAYALKDQEDADYKKAEVNFDIAIDIRDSSELEYFYEFNRAICKVFNDSNFSSKTPSDDITKNQIIEDLRFSKSGLGVLVEELIKKEPENRVLMNWIKLNSIDFNKI